MGPGAAEGSAFLTVGSEKAFGPSYIHRRPQLLVVAKGAPNLAKVASLPFISEITSSVARRICFITASGEVDSLTPLAISFVIAVTLLASYLASMSLPVSAQAD